ncbi:MAG TPA: hypothetical protein DEH78_10195, partial [Solibacterales bacterium]|nr:hypothetical protein [Bryobacterales bacterium]
MRRRFDGKVAIVTGGGTGIGLETARQLVAEGARVVLNGRREAVLHSAAASLGAHNAAVVAGDISQPEVSLRLVEEAEKLFGGVDILINNAG